jgi:hypothetical protein
MKWAYGRCLTALQKIMSRESEADGLSADDVADANRISHAMLVSTVEHLDSEIPEGW